MAMQTAVNRGLFDLSYPSAIGELISSEVVQPAPQGPYVNGIPRAEYTVGSHRMRLAQELYRYMSRGRQGMLGGGPGSLPSRL
jgi:hypothetical protein